MKANGLCDVLTYNDLMDLSKWSVTCGRCNVINAVTGLTLNQIIYKYKIIQYTVYPTYMPTAGVSSASI